MNATVLQLYFNCKEKKIKYVRVMALNWKRVDLD